MGVDVKSHSSSVDESVIAQLKPRRSEAEAQTAEAPSAEKAPAKAPTKPKAPKAAPKAEAPAPPPPAAPPAPEPAPEPEPEPEPEPNPVAAAPPALHVHRGVTGK